jgi:DNA-binding response OmpR family regulator
MRDHPNVSRAESVYRVGDLVMSHPQHRVTLAGNEIHLTRAQYLLLREFIKRPGEVISRQELSLAIWGERLAEPGRPVDQHIYRLRVLLQQAAASAGVPRPVIKPIAGIGYQFVGSALDQSQAVQ